MTFKQCLSGFRVDFVNLEEHFQVMMRKIACYIVQGSFNNSSDQLI